MKSVCAVIAPAALMIVDWVKFIRIGLRTRSAWYLAQGESFLLPVVFAAGFFATGVRAVATAAVRAGDAEVRRGRDWASVGGIYESVGWRSLVGAM